MSKRDTGLALLFIIVFMVLLSFGFNLVRLKYEEYAYTREQITGQYEKHVETGIRVCRGVDGFFAALDCLGEAIQASQQETTAYKGLEAQQDTSVWALGALIVSALSLLVTALGIFFVWRTLVKTSETTAAAVESLKAARKANDLVLIAQRPWLKVAVEPIGQLRMSRKGVFVQCRITLENVGKVPAQSVCVQVVPYDVLGYDFAPEDFWRDQFECAAEITSEGTHLIVLPGEKLRIEQTFNCNFSEASSDTTDVGSDGRLYAFVGPFVTVTYREATSDKVFATPFMGRFHNTSEDGFSISRSRTDEIGVFDADNIQVEEKTLGIGPS
ncbi:MAG: hypothetical protein AAF718_01600 [Pseudomonadota bacterium]